MSTRTIARWTLVAVALSALAGCRPLLDVRLASADERIPAPRFTITSTSDEPVRYDVFELLEQSGTTMWRVRAQQFGDYARSTQITYGVVPEGFETEEGPLPLEEGHTYALFFSSKDPQAGRLHFQVEPGGTVREQQ